MPMDWAMLTSPGVPSRVCRTCAPEIDDADLDTVLIGVGSFFLMPQSPAKTKSWWNPKGYFTEKEEKIIVNSGKPHGLVGL